MELSKIIQHPFPDHQYYREATDKNQITIHHTVSNPKWVDGDITTWVGTAARVATHVIIDFYGNIHQLFSSEFWAHHLGTHEKNNTALNKAALSIELDCWGPLTATEEKGIFKTVYNTKFKSDNDTILYLDKYRGYHYYQRYSQAQIEALKGLLIYWGERHNIDLSYNEDMWDVSPRALAGENGIWSHSSYRKDKSDCHPQPELIEMLKGLTT